MSSGDWLLTMIQAAAPERRVEIDWWEASLHAEVRDKRVLLFPAFQQHFVFLCLITVVFSGLIHELKMSEKIIYIYIYIYIYLANWVGITCWVCAADIDIDSWAVHNSPLGVWTPVLPNRYQDFLWSNHRGLTGRNEHRRGYYAVSPLLSSQSIRDGTWSPVTAVVLL